MKEKSIKKTDKKDAVKERLTPTSFKFNPGIKELLDKLSEKNRRSNVGTLEFLINEAAKKAGLTK